MADDDKTRDDARYVLKMTKFLEDFVSAGPVAALNNVESLNVPATVSLSMIASGLYVIHRHYKDRIDVLIRANTQLHEELGRYKGRTGEEG